MEKKRQAKSIRMKCTPNRLPTHSSLVLLNITIFSFFLISTVRPMTGEYVRHPCMFMPNATEILCCIHYKQCKWRACNRALLLLWRKSMHVLFPLSTVIFPTVQLALLLLHHRFVFLQQQTIWMILTGIRTCWNRIFWWLTTNQFENWSHSGRSFSISTCRNWEQHASSVSRPNQER